MGGGGPSSAEQSQINLQKSQTGIGQQETAAGTARMTQADQIMQPAINFWQQIMGGDPKTMLKAAAPAIGNIAQSEQATEAQIMNSMPPGAGRDLALMQAKMGKNTGIASTLSNLWGQAPGALAQIGGAEQGVSLQQTGAGIRGFEGASQTGGTVLQAEQQRRQAKASMMGSIFSMAGMALGGPLGGALGASLGGMFGGGGGAGSLNIGQTFNPATYYNPSVSDIVSSGLPSTLN